MFWFRDSQNATDDIQARALEARESLDALDAPEGMLGQPEGSEWVDIGVQDIPVGDLPKPNDIHDDNDFYKVFENEMRAGLERLQEM